MLYFITPSISIKLFTQNALHFTVTPLSPPLHSTTGLNDLVLRLVGLRSTEDHSVSEDMLRRVVDEAQRSETGIESEEGTYCTVLL